MMGIYEAFAEQFEGENFKFKIRKPMVFKAFVKFILNRNDENVNFQIEKLQKYIKDEKLTRGKIIDFTDFAKHNKFMALKGKKKHKLDADKVARLHLTHSDDESDDFNGSTRFEEKRI